MTGGDGDLLREAAAELYSADPDEFIQRRGSLAALARAAGQAAAAKSIAALRKPTRSAWVINRLVRSVPGLAGQLSALGDELRAAQRSLDGAAIRQLSQRRRELIDAAAREAFAAAGLDSPSAALKEEVTATLGAALADPQVAEQVQAGTLERAARWDGFGFTGAPALTLVPSRSPSPPPSPPAGQRGRRSPERSPDRPRPGAAARAAEAAAAAEAKAELKRRSLEISEAGRAVEEADRAAGAAASAEVELESSVRAMEEQLADARRRLGEARLTARRARARQRQAKQALGRLQNQQAGRRS